MVAAEYVQSHLNLFGDFINDTNTEQAAIDVNEEATHGQLGNNRRGSLEEVPSQLLQGIEGKGNTGTNNQYSRGTDDRGDVRTGFRPGDETQRSPGDPDAAVHTAAAGIRPPGQLRKGHTDDLGNYRITHDDKIGAGGAVAKFNRNLAAIKLVKLLETEERYATPEEQAVLVQYTGWGGLSEVFKTNQTGAWLERQQALKQVLAENEYNSASRSTRNAHYTDPEIARLIWDAVIRMGYTGGPALEPACGVGHFFGVRPTNLPVVMHGIEMDLISGRIAQNLYQSADIVITPYESQRMQKDYYNLVISNVPFSEIHPYEEKKHRTPGMESGKYALHDYYFLKSLYGLKPGGILAFITSRYTMDKQNNKVREKIAESADFIGAVRLPDNAFKGIANTVVVTDIVFLQKRQPGAKPAAINEVFISTTGITIDDQETTINSYFDLNPQMILGKNSLTGSTNNAHAYTVTPEEANVYDSLRSALNTLPENIFAVADYEENRIKQNAIAAIENEDTRNLPYGSYFIGEDHRLYQKDPVTGNVELSKFCEKEKANSKMAARAIQMVRIAESVRKAINHHYSEQPVEVKKELARLNELYDSFTAQYGYLNDRRNYTLLSNSPESTLLCALEKWNTEKKTAQKADIFSGINFAKKSYVAHVDSPLDAMALSLSRFGVLNIPFMESVAGIERDALVNDLVKDSKIFPDPADYIQHNRVTYVPADLYLSGNIREKIRLAEQAAQQEPALFNRNTDALKNVLPAALTSEEIMLHLNSPIVGEKNVKDFLAELFRVPQHNIDILHLPVNGKWEIELSYAIDMTLRKQVYGTSRLDAEKIINSIMNGKPVKVFDKISEHEYVLNAEETALAEQKADEINAAFQSWVWRDQERTFDIVMRYNEVFNSHVERKYIHPERLVNEKAQVFIYGCNFPFPLRSNQADAVWRILQQKNTMLAHTVGAGKTLEMTCAAMELRRLGLRSKSMIVCPDHMIGQWSNEFRIAYPNAKLLIADDVNWDKKNRQTFINRIATGEWDAIIIRAESFKMIPMSQEYQEKFFTDKIAEYKTVIDSIPRWQRKTATAKQLEKSLEKYKTKIKELADMKKDEGVIPFDRLGIDQLFIDEADLYKNLEYYTQLQNVRGLGTPAGSERSLDMYMKVRYIQSMDGGVVFATGTPISNTLVEAYTMQRMLQPEVLKANGLEAFDEWARQYAETVTQMELSNTGTGYVPVTRFSKIINVPELVTSLRQVWDIQTAQNLEQAGILVPGVNLPRMKMVNEAAPATPLMKSYLKYLEVREKNLSGKPEKGKDNILCIMTDGRKAAIDMRLIHPDLPDDPRSKLNLTVRRIHELYNKYRKEGYTIAVFCDKARSLGEGGNVLFDAIADIKKKLIAAGVRKEDIGDTRECKNYTERQQLFNAINEGEKRIIFGSTETMGAGTNFQKKLKAIVHVDAPWRPRDIEQQNGRGYRPGNTTGELEIYNMVTKGSLDTGLWNLLETKATSIQQVMNGSDKTTRQVEEDYYASVKELAVDNPLMKKVMELDHAIKKLQALQKAHNNEIANASRRLQVLPSEIGQTKGWIGKVQDDIAMRTPEMTGKDFTIILDGKEYTERKEAGALIISLAAEQSGYLNPRESKENVIGSYAGFPLILHTIKYENTMYSEKLFLQARYNRYSFQLKDEPDPVGLIKSLHHTAYHDPENALHIYGKQLDEKIKTKNNYELLITQPFSKEEELKDKEGQYKDAMNKLMLMRGKENNRQESIYTGISWLVMETMSREEIQKMIQDYVSCNTVEKDSNTINQDIQTAANIGREAKNRYAVTIHPLLLEELEKQILEGVLSPDQVMDVIGKTVKEQAQQRRSWHENAKGDGIMRAFAIYAKDSNILAAGDVYIKANPGNGAQYKAYSVSGNSKISVLGEADTIEELKNRTKQYSFSKALKGNISKLTEDQAHKRDLQQTADAVEPGRETELVECYGYGD